MLCAYETERKNEVDEGGKAKQLMIFHTASIPNLLREIAKEKTGGCHFFKIDHVKI